METHALFAEWKGDELHVVASTQAIFSVRDELAQVFGLPKDKVRVQADRGRIGSKFGAGTTASRGAPGEGRLAGKLILDRKEDQLAGGTGDC
jgi:xanthine dehydrogenase YagR molybdenum-binding subunit